MLNVAWRVISARPWVKEDPEFDLIIAALYGNAGDYDLQVGRCRLTVSKPVLKAPTSMVSPLEAPI